jgi:cyclopropane-fatty-acyl-phospholipid synthase
MTYSSAIFKTPDQSLEEAQTEKYDRLCKLLEIQPDEHVLEIGSGWGGFATHAAKNYGCRVTTVTISQQQYNYAKEKFEREGISDRVDIKLQDYRQLTGTFDKIVSIEMLEAVGHKYLPQYFKQCDNLLRGGGRLAIQVILSRDRRYKQFRKDVDFIQKHIFPGSQTPSLLAIQEAIAQVADLNLYDVKDIGQDYARTLRCWFDAFNRQLASVHKLGMEQRFILKWNYYLQYCEALFKTCHVTVQQLVYTKS